MIRNIIILFLVIAVGYLGFQNYSQRLEIEVLDTNYSKAKTQIAHLTRHSFKPVTVGTKDYLALASIYAQNGEDALSKHDYKRASKEYGFARLAVSKATAQGISGQRSQASEIGKRVGHLADQIKQLGEALRG